MPPATGGANATVDVAHAALGATPGNPPALISHQKVDRNHTWKRCLWRPGEHFMYRSYITILRVHIGESITKLTSTSSIIYYLIESKVYILYSIVN